MKKAISILLILVISLAFCACNPQNILYVGSEMGQLENNQDSGNDEILTSNEVWIIDNYVNEFDEPTNEKYISTNTSLTGTFSNSATSNSTLSVNFLIDITDGEYIVSIFLYEFGNLHVINPYNQSRDYTVTMQCSDGTTIEFAGIMPSGDDRLYIASNDAGLIVNELCRSGDEIKLYIVENKRATNYSFSVPKANFYQKLKELISGYIPNTGSNSNNGNTNSTIDSVGIEQPIEEKKYVLYLYQERIEQHLYVNGQMNSYYLATSYDKNDAIRFMVEKNGTGYHLYHIKGGQKEYLNIIKNGQYINVVYQATPNSVYRYDSILQTLVTTVDGKDYFLGNMKQYTFVDLAPCLASDYASYYIAHFDSI